MKKTSKLRINILIYKVCIYPLKYCLGGRKIVLSGEINCVYILGGRYCFNHGCCLRGLKTFV